MRFVDLAKITVNAGDGGRGCSAFAQPPYTRFPYPDGGDGGDGGDVIVRADPNVATLLDFQFRHEFKAGRGGHGGSNTRTGKRGEDRLVLVPVGTVIRETADGPTLSDLTGSGEEVIVARGGRGGYGNATRAASAKQLEKTQHRAQAAEATAGEAGEQRALILELKLIADAGIVGFPNAGKSSLLRRLSTARPKVGAYPFTTRYPVLGVVEAPGRGSFVACDIPGLIEGAHEGKGLGIQFLRHIERTRVLVHLVDLAGVDGRDPVEAYHGLNEELAAYHESLASKPQVIAANKMDLPAARSELARFSRAVGGRVLPVSCATGEGIPALIEAVWEALQQHG
ncbi:MAG: GTPase ObgE [Candidatus Omnitrophica bacterium]|nr:GTPase ObgE [Candidatus Omnitrophota bacterium]